MIAVLPILVFVILSYSAAAGNDVPAGQKNQSKKLRRLGSDEPCWCEPLQKSIEESTRLLVERYGKIHLEASSLFATSGMTHSLKKRLYRSLEHKIPFRLISFGGSFALPCAGLTVNGVPSKGSYVHNITRWLNSVLSSSECRVHDHPLPGLKGKCSGVKEESDIGTCKQEFSQFSLKPSLFCSNNDSLGSEYHSIENRSRPIARVCDNTHNILPKDRRPCTLYKGSGPYATVTAAAQGGTTTNSAQWTMHKFFPATDNYGTLFFQER
jgi:hypothetical protein